MVERIKAGSFASVIHSYLASAKFNGLSPATQRLYRHILAIAERPETLGAYSTDVIRPALTQAFLDGLADKPGIQSNAKTALRALEKWAIVRDLVSRPFTLGTEVIGSDGGHEPWTDTQVELAERLAPPALARVVTLAANTGQRGSDLVRMRWSDMEDYDGRPGINVRQQKTGLKIWIPFTQELMRAISTWQRQPTFILLKTRGAPWTRPQLSDQWLVARDTKPALAPLKAAGLVLHGLRGTACVRLLRAGANTRQIADMVGMSEQTVKRYVRFAVQKDNALAAVHYLDRTEIERLKNERQKNGS